MEIKSDAVSCLWKDWGSLELHLREEFLVVSSSQLLVYKVRLMNFKWVLDHQSTVQNTNEKKGQSVNGMHIIHSWWHGPNLRMVL